MSSCVSVDRSLTVNDLSAKLRSARYKRWLDKEYNVGVRKHTPSHHRNDVRAAVLYFDRYLCLGVNAYVKAQKQTEDEQACLLYDLSHMPYDMVMERLASRTK